MKTIFLPALAAVAACLLSCRQTRETGMVLDEIETSVMESPDSAYTVLSSIDRRSLKTRDLKARHSLLLSIAAEASGIEPVDDSLVRAAFNYYCRSGSESGKARTFYLLGRLNEDAGNKSAAMFCYVAACRHATTSESPELRGHLYSSKARLQENSFDFMNAMENYSMACREYLDAKDFRRYATSCLKAASCCMETGDMDSASGYIAMLSPYSSLLEGKDMVRYSGILSRVHGKRPDKGIRDALKDRIMDEGKPGTDGLMALSGLYLDSGCADSAMNCLEQYAAAVASYRSLPEYYLLLSKTQDSLGHHREALDAYRRHVVLKDSLWMERIQENVRFVESKYDEQARLFRLKTSRLLILYLSTAVILIAVFFTVRYRKKFWTQKRKTSHLEHLYRSVSAEKDALNDMVSHSVMIDEATRKVLEGRGAVLNEIVTQRLLDKDGYSPEQASDLIESIVRDKDIYLNILGLMFSLRHPGFASYLKKHQLETWEIGYCSLYCMGYKGKEVGSMLCSSRCYKINSAIRKKLGVGPNETNLDIYLRKLMASTEEENVR